jgi:hypothetical protein
VVNDVLSKSIHNDASLTPLTIQSNVFCIIGCALGNELLTRDAGEGRLDVMRADGSYDEGIESDVIVI